MFASMSSAENERLYTAKTDVMTTNDDMNDALGELAEAVKHVVALHRRHQRGLEAAEAAFVWQADDAALWREEEAFTKEVQAFRGKQVIVSKGW